MLEWLEKKSFPRALEHCIGDFLDSCDQDQDHRITIKVCTEMPTATVFPHKYILSVRRSGANAWSWERRSWRQSARSWIWSRRRRRKKTKKMMRKRTRSIDHSCNFCLIQTCKLKTTWQYNPVVFILLKIQQRPEFRPLHAAFEVRIYSAEKQVFLEVKKIFSQFSSIDRLHRRP